MVSHLELGKLMVSNFLLFVLFCLPSALENLSLTHFLFLPTCPVSVLCAVLVPFYSRPCMECKVHNLLKHPIHWSLHKLGMYLFFQLHNFVLVPLLQMLLLSNILICLLFTIASMPDLAWCFIASNRRLRILRVNISRFALSKRARSLLFFGDFKSAAKVVEFVLSPWDLS
jgi:hypothetical protein